MKLISLNTWGGRAGKEGLLSFLKKRADVDIFCLQEIWSAPYEHLEGSKAGGRDIVHENIMVYGMQEISALLSEHQSYFYPHHMDNYGLMMLVKNDIKIIEEGEIFVYKHKGYLPEGDVGNHARNIQYVTFQKNGKKCTAINFHGLWNGKGKSDCKERLMQSEKIVEFVTQLSNPFVLCGDFNLLLDTESVAILEKAGLKNLIREYGISSTRTSYYTKPEKHADYVFVSKGIEVLNFQVLPDEVSDHAPLFIDFEYK